MYTNGVTREEQVTMMAIQSINQKIPDIELKDLFAIFAMNGLISDPNRIQTAGSCEIAEIAYEIANEMIKARSNK